MLHGLTRRVFSVARVTGHTYLNARCVSTRVTRHTLKEFGTLNARPYGHVSSCFGSAFMSTSAASNQDDSAVQHEFKAETRQLLDIVTHSIYTDKEVFIRELISNASDALEKLRHLEATGESIEHPELEATIQITTDETTNTLTIHDTGIGMTKDELTTNLGTIARSGSKAFLDQLKEKNVGGESADALSGIIGKFGVGFYSAFMVADRIEVFSHSAFPNEPSHVWRSDGSGSFEVAPVSDTSAIERGSKIVIYLKENCKDYANAKKIESIIQRYSNFVSFPIEINNEPVNTVQALWTKNENEIKDKEYTEFYKFIANAFDEPMYRLHFKADAPIELKTLFFIGSTHTEKFGYGRLEPGVSLYSRKVLIERNSKDILPDWLRFVRGVVDSEDLPLSLSREKMQDSKLILKIKDVLTRRILRFLEQQSIKEPEKFDQFFKEFGQFLKEGACSDFQHKSTIAKLLRYESSAFESGKNITLDEYISRLSPVQNEIYFLCAPTREIAELSPYYEAFKKTKREVIFVYNPVDDFVLNNIGEFNGRKIVSAEHAKLDLEEENESKNLTLEQQDLFSAWIRLTLGEKIKDIKFTTRLSNSPAIISDHESAVVRKMMMMVNERTGQSLTPTSQHTLEINPSHRIIKDLNELREQNPSLAEKVAKQIYTNACLAAGLIEDGRIILSDLNEILGELLDHSLKSSTTRTSLTETCSITAEESVPIDSNEQKVAN